MGEKTKRPDNWNPGVGPVPDRMEKDLELELFFGLYTSAMKACIDAIGSERTMEFMTPYWVLMGKGHPHLFTEIFPTGYPFGRDEISAHFTVQLSNLAMGRKMSPFYLTDKGGYSDMLECPYRDTLPELCVLVCYDCDRAIYEEFEGNLVPVVFRLEADGRRFCRWIIKKRGASNEDPYDVGQPYAWLNLRDIDPELRSSMVGATNVNPWIHLTRSMVDALGRDRALKILGDYLRHFGHSIGLRMRSGALEEGSDALAISRLLDQINEAAHQRGKVIEASGEKVVKEITECPLSGSPPEIGQQLESFANGVCEVINPEFEVKHIKAMCRGDQSCIRAVQRKAEPLRVRSDRIQKPLTHSNDNLEVLKSRLARGELSLEEYRLLKQELSD